MNKNVEEVWHGQEYIMALSLVGKRAWITIREGKEQPKMKQKAIDRENSRDKITGYLPAK